MSSPCRVPHRLRYRLFFVLGLTAIGPVAACCYSKEHVKDHELCYDQAVGVTSACAPLPGPSSSSWYPLNLHSTDRVGRAGSRLCETNFTSGPVRRETVGGQHDCCYRADVTYCPTGGRALRVSSTARLAEVVAAAGWAS